MEFFLSSETGLPEDQLQKLCQIQKGLQEKLKIAFGNKSYGDAIKGSIGIIPVIMTNHDRIIMEFKERKLYSKKRKDADYRLAIDYDEFIKANDKEKERLLLENIIHAIRDLKRKIRKGFDGDKLESDILQLFKLEPKDIRERVEKEAP
jgi:Immunity protein 44